METILNQDTFKYESWCYWRNAGRVFRYVQGEVISFESKDGHHTTGRVRDGVVSHVHRLTGDDPWLVFSLDVVTQHPENPDLHNLVTGSVSYSEIQWQEQMSWTWDPIEHRLSGHRLQDLEGSEDLLSSIYPAQYPLNLDRF